MSDSIQGFNAELILDFKNLDKAIDGLTKLNELIGNAKTGTASLGTSVSRTPRPGGSAGQVGATQDTSFKEAMRELKDSVARDKLVATTNANIAKDAEKKRIADLMAGYKNEEELAKEVQSKKAEEARQSKELGTSLKWLSGIALTVGTGLLKLLEGGAKESHVTSMASAMLAMNPSDFLKWQQLGGNLIGDESAGPSALAAMNRFTQKIKTQGSLQESIPILMGTGLGKMMSADFLKMTPEQQVLSIANVGQKLIAQGGGTARTAQFAMSEIFGGEGIGKILYELNTYFKGISIGKYMEGETSVSNKDIKTLEIFDILKDTALNDFANALKPFQATLATMLTPALRAFDDYIKSGAFQNELKAFSTMLKFLGDWLVGPIFKLIGHVLEMSGTAGSLFNTWREGGDTNAALKALNYTWFGLGGGEDSKTKALKESLSSLLTNPSSHFESDIAKKGFPLDFGQILSYINPSSPVSYTEQVKGIIASMGGPPNNFTFTINQNKSTGAVEGIDVALNGRTVERLTSSGTVSGPVR